MPTDHSSAAHGKRVRSAIAAHRLRSPLIGGLAGLAGLAEPFGDLFGIEAKARAATPAKAVRAELVGVVIDPAAADAPPPCDLLGGEEPASGSSWLAGRQQFGEAVRERLDRIGIEPDLALAVGH